MNKSKKLGKFRNYRDGMYQFFLRLTLKRNCDDNDIKEFEINRRMLLNNLESKSIRFKSWKFKEWGHTICDFYVHMDDFDKLSLTQGQTDKVDRQ